MACAVHYCRVPLFVDADLLGPVIDDRFGVVVGDRFGVVVDDRFGVVVDDFERVLKKKIN